MKINEVTIQKRDIAKIVTIELDSGIKVKVTKWIYEDDYDGVTDYDAQPYSDEDKKIIDKLSDEEQDVLWDLVSEISLSI